MPKPPKENQPEGLISPKPLHRGKRMCAILAALCDMATHQHDFEPIGGDGISGGDVLNRQLLAELSMSLSDPMVAARVASLAQRLPPDDQVLVQQAIGCLRAGLVPDDDQLGALVDAGFTAGATVYADGRIEIETFMT